MKGEKWKQTCENLNPRNSNTKLWHLAKQIDRAQPQIENTNMNKNTDGTPATNDKNAANLLEKHEQGVRVVALSRQFGRSTSMICSVLKRKESIKSVSLGKSMGLEMEERDVNELIEEHTQELTTEEIKELQSQQHPEVMQVIGFEESEEEVISTSEIKEILGMWERVSHFVEKKHPEKVATGRASDLFNDTCLTHFRNILRGRKKQTSLDMFFSKRPTGESEKNVAKKAKTRGDI
ncbi:hypothetical protein LAZ67_13000689 [Cordylochernes scorpioides]|uniref:HTH psq-type domain-containing protein n=1 Tax=Cordylochernes scorpioides TaxID=51811 RepID=A0ABY6L374_9ARAC|nr:hypothetical protein LAZ67_13000689 [Cordylochernes scorpioides]